jgi:hypothetical protein
MKTTTILIASALLLGATSASFAQATMSFAAGAASAEQDSGSYPAYGNAPRGYGYYNYAPGYLANHPAVRRHSHIDTGAQR